MASRNFTQFALPGQLESNDFLVGYNAAGTQEIRITAFQIFERIGIQFNSSFNSITTIQGENNATGTFSFAVNQNNTASGIRAFAIGFLNVASGANSSAQGVETLAIGQNSHTEGQFTISSARNSHAEGESAAAGGINSHAEGSSTSALGFASHAENESNTASGRGSHAQGLGTIAQGNYSNTYGVDCVAQGEISTAGGYTAIAVHDQSWIWKGAYDGNFSYTTRENQFMVSADGGVSLNKAVGINTESIANALTVNGVISGNNLIYDRNGNSGQWNATHTIVQSNSALWGLGGSSSNIDTGVRALTSIWDNTTTVVQSNSALWTNTIDSEVRALTSTWDNTTTVVQNNSAQWAITGDSEVRALTSTWDNTTTVVQSNSALWAITADSEVRALTGSFATLGYVQTNYLNLTGGEISGDLILQGSLFVTGTGSYIDFVDFRVTDPTLYLGIGNPDDSLDLGIIGVYNSLVYDEHKHTGLIRNHIDKKWVLFSNLTACPLSTANIALDDNSVVIDTLKANLEGNINKQDIFITGNILGSNSHVSFNNANAIGLYSFAVNAGVAAGNNSTALGVATSAVGQSTFAYGFASEANNIWSVVGGYRAISNHNNTWVWRGGSPNGGSAASTANYQFLVSAEGGIALYDKVGIGTDSKDNALTVVGTISTSEHGDSNLWNSTYTTVNTNANQWNSVYTIVNTTSATWESGGINLETVTDYLSTNNIQVNGLTVTNDISTTPNIKVSLNSGNSIHINSFIWSGPDSAVTTRGGQFMVGNATGGIYLSGSVGINTDNIDRALTVVGDISATGNIFGKNTIVPQSGETLTAVVSVFTTSGTWTKPLSARSIHVSLVGGGGGGGSGRYDNASTARGGGAGGSGAGFTQLTLNPDSLPDTITVTVGAGGSGGPSVTTLATDGNSGIDGGNSLFGLYGQSGGGRGGAGGINATQTVRTPVGTGMFNGGEGGVGQVGTSSANRPGGNAIGAGGGGGGGGCSSANSNSAGGDGGVSNIVNISSGIGGITNGGNGTSGNTASINQPVPGSGGGGGGGANTGNNGGNGGDGGLYGAGGGGGGGSNLNRSGAGGNGGNGIVVVTAYF